MAWSKYFDAAKRGDLLAAFDAMVGLGMRPLPVGECDKSGTLKKPFGQGWGIAPVQERRKTLERLIEQSVPVGIGCQADGYAVLDIDPPGKDRSQLPQAWKEAATILLGGEDWPRTLIIKTAAGCHVWFKITSQELLTKWQNHGKLALSLPCGGKVEFFTGNNKQMQVACPPSDGKAVVMETPPADLPRPVESAILDLLEPRDVAVATATMPLKTEKAGPVNEQWFYDRLLKLTERVLNANSGERHDTYRAACRTIGGYAAGMNLQTEEKFEQAYNHLALAHKEAKPEVTDYVLVETFKWGWNKGLERPLTPPFQNTCPEIPAEFRGDQPIVDEAANAADILALMDQREWLWGSKETKVGWFQTGKLHLLEGKEGTGKTRWILDLVKRWSLDQNWPDGSKITIDTDSKILFCAADSHWDQIATTSQDFGIPLDNVIFSGPKTDPYDFTNIDEFRTIEALARRCDQYKIALIVVDTLMAATSKPLVDRQEVAQLSSPLRKLARDKNVAIVVVGHLNKDGETYGRAMQGMCENVIRMEADLTNPQEIKIQSVKARWNRFAMPVLHARQRETGWEYSTTNSDGNNSEQTKGRAAAMDLVKAYLATVGRSAWGEIISELEEQGVSKSTTNRALKYLVETDEIVTYKEKFPSGKECSFYEIDPRNRSDSY